MRDITLGETIDFKFTTAEPDTGAPIALAGTPAISAYIGNSTTQITAGITLSVDFDGVTGLNNVRVVATSGNGYTDQSDVALIITTGTVDSVSAVGYKVAEFTIGRSAANSSTKILARAAYLVDTTIATLASQTSFTLTAGSADDDAYNGMAFIFTDASTATQKGVAFCSDYVGSTRTVTLEAGPDFTIATSDLVTVVPAGSSTSVPLTAQLADDGITAAKLAADAITEIQSGLATSAQLNNIAVAGAPVFRVASSFTQTTGSVTSGTVSSTQTSDNTRHVLADAAGTLEAYYEFNIGGDGVANSVQFEGYLTGSNDSVGVYARNWAGSSWDQIGTITGGSATTDSTSQWNLTVSHTGTGANLGLVRIRFQNTGLSTASLNIDRILVGYAILNRSVGYQDAAVWIDTVNGTAGTESYVNGTVDKPVSSLADAITIATAVGLRRFHLNNGSSITLASSFAQRDFIGENWTCALGSQALTSCLITGATVSGTCTGSGNIFTDCEVSATLPPCLMHECGISALTVGSAGEFDLIHCHADADPAIIDFGAAVGATDFHLRGASGDWEVRNLLTGDGFEMDGDGEVTLAASVTGGTVKIAGNVHLINSGSGITLDDVSRFATDQIIDANVEQINTVAVVGAGTSGDKWRA